MRKTCFILFIIGLIQFKAYSQVNLDTLTKKFGDSLVVNSLLYIDNYDKIVFSFFDKESIKRLPRAKLLDGSYTYCGKFSVMNNLNKDTIKIVLDIFQAKLNKMPLSKAKIEINKVYYWCKMYLFELEIEKNMELNQHNIRHLLSFYESNKFSSSIALQRRKKFSFDMGDDHDIYCILDIGSEIFGRLCGKPIKQQQDFWDDIIKKLNSLGNTEIPYKAYK